MLVIDDEPMILHVVTRMVMRLGAQPVGVGSLADARALLAAERFDLVLSDVALGDGSGLDLALALIAAGSPPVVLMSGSHERLEDAAGRIGVRILPKPITLEALERVIAETVARPRT